VFPRSIFLFYCLSPNELNFTRFLYAEFQSLSLDNYAALHECWVGSLLADNDRINRATTHATAGGFKDQLEGMFA
jgi:hypothetical protein